MVRNASTTEELHRLRAGIDGLNREILALLEQRAELVDALAEIKEELDLPAHDPRREEEMLRKLSREARGLLAESDVRAVFSAIFGVGLAQQRRRDTGKRSRGGLA